MSESLQEIETVTANQTLDPGSPERVRSTLERSELEKNLRLISETRDLREALGYVQRAVELAPDDPRVRQSLYGMLLALTDRDPFVAYVMEDENSYVIKFRNSRPFVVPKGRGNIDVFPRVARTEGERILRMLRWSLLGLIPGGLGAILLLPVFYLWSCKLLIAPGIPDQDRHLAIVALYLSSAFAFLGAVLFGLLLLHWVG